MAKQQGDTMANGLIKRRSFVLNHKAKDFIGKGALLHTNRLFVCEETVPPNYRNDSGNTYHEVPNAEDSQTLVRSYCESERSPAESI